MNDVKDKYIRNLKIVSCILIVLIFVLTLVVVDLLSNRFVKTNTNDAYVEVVETYDGFLLGKDVDSDSKYTIKTDDNYKIGDVLYVTYLKDIEKPKSIELVLNKKSEETTDVVSSESKEIKEKVTKNESVVPTTTNVVNTTNEVTTKKVIVNENIDNIVLSYVDSIKTKVDNYSNNENNKKTAKEYFCSIVDFIFYDGTIKGHTFNELSTSAKAKVIYYALILDNKIDNKYPGYKDTLGDKYNDIKAKLIGKYLSLVEYVKVNQPELYEDLKYDFLLLKSSCNFTWSIVSGAFKYVGGNVVNLAKEWYTNFRG